MDMTGSVSTHIAAPPDRVFAAITDLRRLPGWNRRMTGVVEVPEELVAGSEWVVGFRYLGRRFNSRSVVTQMDKAHRLFAYRSKPEDDNPSCTAWTWHVEPEDDGSRVTVGWQLMPATLLRRVLLAPLRAYQIPRVDLARSLAALASRCEVVATATHTPERGLQGRSDPQDIR